MNFDIKDLRGGYDKPCKRIECTTLVFVSITTVVNFPYRTPWSEKKNRQSSSVYLQNHNVNSCVKNVQYFSQFSFIQWKACMQLFLVRKTALNRLHSIDAVPFTPSYRPIKSWKTWHQFPHCDRWGVKALCFRLFYQHCKIQFKDFLTQNFFRMKNRTDGLRLVFPRGKRGKTN